LNPVVIDASVALAWCFPDEASDYADRVLVAVEGRVIRVPALWATEVSNALLVAERRRRIKAAETQRFLSLLDGLTITVDSLSLSENFANLLPLGRAHGLSAYDAAYLDVALRHAAPLASLDGHLCGAAVKSGIEVFAGER